MGWVDRLVGMTVALDTASLTYFIEEHSKYLSLILPFFELVEVGEICCVTSVLTITESLVQPLRLGRADLAARQLDVLLDSNHIVVEISRKIAEEAARLRADHRLKTPDAIQNSIAIQMNATAIVKNDLGIRGLTDVEVVNLDDLIRGSP